MMERLAIATSLLLALSASACSEANGIVFSRSQGGQSDDRGEKPAEHSSNATADGGAALPGVAADASTPPQNAFANAGDFSLITPRDESSLHHGTNGNAGMQCLTCHTQQGAPQFAFAGTVFLTSAATEGASGVQVRIVGPDGAEVALVGTDSTGNFWLESTATIPSGSSVAIRNARATKSMTAPLAAGDCNQSGCHSSQRPISLGD